MSHYNKKKTVLSFLPLSLPMILLFGSGIFFIFGQSFGFFLPINGDEGACAAWVKTVQDLWFWKSLIYSLGVAIISALLSVILGSMLAWFIHTLPPIWQSKASVFRLFLIFPHITIAYIVLLFWEPKGIISSLAFHLNFLSESSDFPNIIYGGRGVGLIFAYILKGAAFSCLMVLGVLGNLKDDLIYSAQMFSANSLQVWTAVIFPHIKSVISSSFLILMLYALGGVEIPWLIGESRPQMIGVYAYNLYFYTDISRRSEAATVLSILLIFSCLLISLFYKFLGRFFSYEK